MTRTPIAGRPRPNDLPGVVRAAIVAHTGAISHVDLIGAGRNHQLAAVVHTTGGAVFVKGMRADHPGAWTQQVEARINPYVLVVAPRLRWQARVGGWNLLAFDHVAGHPANLAPGSADLPAVAAMLRRLGDLPTPDVPLKRIEQRWAAYADPGELALLAGDSLLHTDLNPGNLLVADTGVSVVDWAWPTAGAGWIDPACLALWLIAEGHTPARAEAWAWAHTHLAGVDPNALDVFTAVNRRLWRSIADDNPQPWKQRVAAAAHHWYQHRHGHAASPRP